MPADTGVSTQYSTTMGFLYVFNLIVGTGALALPKAFQTAGYVLSIIVLLVSCLVSYIAATFVIEALSVANAVNARKCKEQAKQQSRQFDDVVVSESDPSLFEIVQKVEVGHMTSMFLGRSGVIFSYLALSIYLFGDLAIYSTTVPKSLMNVICAPINTSSVMPTDPCREGWPEFFHRFTVYRLCVVLFVTICTPMVIIGVAKTKYLQLATSFSRWSAFILMIALATAQMVSSGAAVTPTPVNIHGFGSLFGTAVYAFMCHHSIPALITPMRSKTGLFFKLSGIYLLVLAFYFTLSITALRYSNPDTGDWYSNSGESVNRERATTGNSHGLLSRCRSAISDTMFLSDICPELRKKCSQLSRTQKAWKSFPIRLLAIRHISLGCVRNHYGYFEYSGCTILV
uniref:Aa_trans domain-containing protein n=1 Tax=Haemonchus contortus TaxID=6289 RepID=A0A7I4Z1F8_HAECO